MVSSIARRRLATAVAALGLAVGAAVLMPAPAQAAGVGYVRLAHLSPDTPAVDVYLTAQAGSLKQKFDAVPYGVMSAYLSLPIGSYAVAMRRVGAPESSEPVLTTQVVVAEGRAYTVAGVGRFASLGLEVFADDLASPVEGKAKIRVIQASVRATTLDVSTAAGESIADGAAFPSTTNYVAVEPGTGNIQMTATGAGPSGRLWVDLRSGSVYTLLILDTADGKLKAELRTDARGNSDVPFGGVDTGVGGTANAPQPRTLGVVAATVAMLLVAAGVVAVRRPRRLR